MSDVNDEARGASGSALLAGDPDIAFASGGGRRMAMAWDPIRPSATARAPPASVSASRSTWACKSSHAAPLLRRSPHVLYTNVVEPILRWTFAAGATRSCTRRARGRRPGVHPHGQDGTGRRPPGCGSSTTSRTRSSRMTSRRLPRRTRAGLPEAADHQPAHGECGQDAAALAPRAHRRSRRAGCTHARGGDSCWPR